MSKEELEQIERWRAEGSMPDWVYYQRVNVPWYISIPAQVDKFKAEALARQAQRDEARQKDAQEKELYAEAEKIAVKAFADVFKGL